MKQGIRTAFKVFTNQKRTVSHSQQPDPIQKQAVKTPGPITSLFTVKRLTEAISKARDRFLAIQNAKGYWAFDLEADSTIPSEYILLQRFLDRETAPDLKEGMGNYLRNRQNRENEMPCIGSVASRVRGANSRGVPAYVALQRTMRYGRPAYIGKGYGPFNVTADPSRERFRVDNLGLASNLTADRLRNRRDLLAQIDCQRELADTKGV